MKNNPSLKTQAKSIFIGSLVGIIFQFLIPMVLVRIISSKDFGIFRQFQLLGSTFLGFLTMGYVTSLFYFYPISDWKYKQKIIQQTEFLYFINTLIFILIFVAFGDYILEVLNFQEFSDIKLAIILYVAFMLLSSGLSVIFTVEKNILLNKIYPAIERISSFFVFLILIYLYPGKMGAILALVVHAGLRLVFYFIYIGRYIKKIYKIDYVFLKKQLLYSLPFGLALILNLVATKFDKFFINRYITPEEFGVYSLAFLGIPILGQFFASIHNVVVPQISIYFNEKKIDSVIHLWQKTVDKTSSLTIPAVFLFLILADEFITILYTQEYIAAANYYRIFVMSFFISMFSYNIILRGANKTKFILLSDVIGTIITVISGIILIPRIGLYGAVITALIGTIMPMLISLHIERRLLNIKVGDWFNWKTMGLNFTVCFFISLPLFLFKDNIQNIYLRSISVLLIFSIALVFLQIKLNIFVFNQFLPFLNNLKMNKIINRIRNFME